MYLFIYLLFCLQYWFYDLNTFEPDCRVLHINWVGKSEDTHLTVTSFLFRHDDLEICCEIINFLEGEQIMKLTVNSLIIPL